MAVSVLKNLNIEFHVDKELAAMAPVDDFSRTEPMGRTIFPLFRDFPGILPFETRASVFYKVSPAHFEVAANLAVTWWSFSV